MALARASSQTPPSRLCNICTNIDVRQPYYGPVYIRAGSSVATQIFYQHGNSLNEVKASAIGEGCHMCQILLEIIRQCDEDGDDNDEDWEFPEEIFESSGDASVEKNVNPELLRQHRAFFHEPLAKAEDVDNTSQPILLEVTFRNQRRDEIAGRCIDIAVHWSRVDGCDRRRTAALSLVSGLSGERYVVPFNTGLRTDMLVLQRT